MVDFLRQNPYVTREEYMWKWTIPQIQLASFDFTHVVYLSEKEIENKKKKNEKVLQSPIDVLAQFGLPIIKK